MLCPGSRYANRSMLFCMCRSAYSFNGLPRPTLGMILVKLGCPRFCAMLDPRSQSSPEIRLFLWQCLGGSYDHYTRPRGRRSVSRCRRRIMLAHGCHPYRFLHFSLPYMAGDGPCDMPEPHSIAVRETLVLTTSPRLQIDWGKSRAWARDLASQHWWLDHGPSLLPSPTIYVIPIQPPCKES